jgi:hypothetical protein
MPAINFEPRSDGFGVFSLPAGRSRARGAGPYRGRRSDESPTAAAAGLPAFRIVAAGALVAALDADQRGLAAFRALREPGRPRPRIGGRGRAGRIGGGRRLQARAAAAATRQARGFSGSGHRRAPALPDRGHDQDGTRRARRTPRQARLPGAAHQPDIAGPRGNQPDLSPAVVGLFRRRSAAGGARARRGRRQDLIARRSEPRGLRLARSDHEPCRMDPPKPYSRRAAVALAGVVPGSRRRALPADADCSLPAGSLAAIRAPARHRRRQGRTTIRAYGPA